MSDSAPLIDSGYGTSANVLPVHSTDSSVSHSNSKVKFLSLLLFFALLLGIIIALGVLYGEARSDLKHAANQQLDAIFGCQASPFDPVTQPQRSAIHASNRLQFFQLWSLPFSQSSYVLLQGGRSSTKYSSDTELAFQQDSNFIYLTGVLEPDCAAMLQVPPSAPLPQDDPASLNWTLFVTRRDSRYAVWNGYILTPADYALKYGATEVRYLDELPIFLQNLTKQDPADFTFFTLSDAAFPQGTFPNGTAQNASALSGQLAQSRMVKTPGEVEMLRVASSVSAEAHVAVMRYVQGGLFEYQAEARFTEFSQSCSLIFPSYLPIVGSGYNSAILHYIANGDLMNRSDVLLIDAAYTYYGYTSDITRTYPVSGRFSADQRVVYEMVLSVQNQSIRQLGPGANFTAIMRQSKALVLEQLLANGFVNGSVPEMLAAGVDLLFMNHGLGHMVGLDVHDPVVAGGYSALKAGMVLTVEPGIYFNEALLGPALTDPLYAPFLVAGPIEYYLDTKFGGVRIEDVVLIVEDPAEGYEILSKNVPNTISGIEKIMKHHK